MHPLLPQRGRGLPRGALRSAPRLACRLRAVCRRRRREPGDGGGKVQAGSARTSGLRIARLVGLMSGALSWVVAAPGRAAAAGSGSAIPTVTPNGSTLPGTGTLVQMLGGLQLDAVLVAIAGVIIGAAVWALSSHSGQYQGVSRGRTAVLASALAAVVIGFGPEAVHVLFNLGQSSQ